MPIIRIAKMTAIETRKVIAAKSNFGSSKFAFGRGSKKVHWQKESCLGLTVAVKQTNCKMMKAQTV